MTTLGLGDNNIGVEGAKAIAEALKVNAVLTKLSLLNNNLGDAGEKAVRDAVKDRSGYWICVGAVENDCASTVNMCGSLFCVL